jgi:hypothetical protein
VIQIHFETLSTLNRTSNSFSTLPIRSSARHAANQEGYFVTDPTFLEAEYELKFLVDCARKFDFPLCESDWSSVRAFGA